MKKCYFFTHFYEKKIKMWDSALKDLTERGFLSIQGAGRGTHYVL